MWKAVYNSWFHLQSLWNALPWYIPRSTALCWYPFYNPFFLAIVRLVSNAFAVRCVRAEPIKWIFRWFPGCSGPESRNATEYGDTSWSRWEQGGHKLTALFAYFSVEFAKMERGYCVLSVRRAKVQFSALESCLPSIGSVSFPSMEGSRPRFPISPFPHFQAQLCAKVWLPSKALTRRIHLGQVGQLIFIVWLWSWAFHCCNWHERKINFISATLC